MARTTYTPSQLPFIVDPHTIVRNGGRQVDWETLAGEDPAVTSVSAGSLMVEVALTGLILPYGSAPGAETPSMILESNASVDDAENIGALGYGCIVGGVIYSNLLPDAEDVGFDDALAALQDAGTGFVFETYADSRG
jgi:hypothetical protein